MNPVKSSLLLLGAVTALSIGSTPVFAKGGMDGGGGNVCFVSQDNAPVLLDLVPSSSAGKLSLSNAPGVQIEVTDFLEEFGIDALTQYHRDTLLPLSHLDKLGTLYTKPLRDEVEKILSSGLRTSPVTARLISRYLDEEYFFAINFGIKMSYGADYGQTPKCSDQNTQAVVFNVGGGLVLIEASVWNRLSLGMQAATLIHEGFRFIQTQTVSPMSNEQLQGIVSKIMTGQLEENLDDSIVIASTDGKGFKLSSASDLQPFEDSFVELHTALWEASINLIRVKEEIFNEKEKMFFLNPKKARYSELLKNGKRAVLSTIMNGIKNHNLQDTPISFDSAFNDHN